MSSRPATRTRVRELCEAAFAEAGLDWQRHVEVDPRYLRPTEVDALEGDAEKARTRLDWRPRVPFRALVKMMVEHDLGLARRERTLKSAGYVEPARGAATNGS